MRELPEEIKSIPRCHCDVPVRGFEDVEYNFSIAYCRCGGLISAVQTGEIEPFDITKHEWSDNAKDCHILFNSPSWAGGDLQICISDPNGNYADDILIKEHAIAIAKHFNLTAEDLK